MYSLKYKIPARHFPILLATYQFHLQDTSQNVSSMKKKAYLDISSSFCRNKNALVKL